MSTTGVRRDVVVRSRDPASFGNLTLHWRDLFDGILEMADLTQNAAQSGKGKVY